MWNVLLTFVCMGLFEFATLGLIKDIVTAPIAVVADVVTLGGTLNDRDKPYTATTLENMNKHVEEILDDE